MKLLSIYKKVLKESKDDYTKSAGAIIYCKSTNRVLLQLRSNVVDEPLVWSTIGGGLNSGESPTAGCKREIKEETGYDGDIKLVTLYENEFPDKKFIYYNFIGIVDKEFQPKNNFESTGHQWFNYGTWPLNTHCELMKAIYSEEGQKAFDEIIKK